MLRIENKAEHAELYISGTIIDDEEGGRSRIDGYEFPREIQRQLEQCRGKQLTVYINSPGGSVSAGLAIAHMLERHDAATTAIVDGYCCSIATQIFFSANECKMPTNAYIFVHKPTCLTMGTATDMKKAAETLDRIQEGLETTYQKKARDSVTTEQIHELVEEETWLTAREAADLFEIKLMPGSGIANCMGRRSDVQSRMVPSAIRFVDEDVDARVQEALQLAGGILNEKDRRIETDDWREKGRARAFACGGEEGGNAECGGRVETTDGRVQGRRSN